MIFKSNTLVQSDTLCIKCASKKENWSQFRLWSTDSQLYWTIILMRNISVNDSFWSYHVKLQLEAKLPFVSNPKHSGRGKSATRITIKKQQRRCRRRRRRRLTSTSTKKPRRLVSLFYRSVVGPFLFAFFRWRLAFDVLGSTNFWASTALD